LEAVSARPASDITIEAWDFDRSLVRACKTGVAATEDALKEVIETRLRLVSTARKALHRVKITSGAAHEKAYADARATVERLKGERSYRTMSSGLAAPLGRAVAKQLKADAKADSIIPLLASTGSLRPELRRQLTDETDPGSRFQIVQNHSLALVAKSVRKRVGAIDPKEPLGLVLNEWRAWLKMEAILHWVHAGIIEPLDHPDIAIDILDSGSQDGMDKIFRYGELHARRIALCDVDVPPDEVLASFQRGLVVRSMSEQNSVAVRVEHRIWAGCPEECYDESAFESSPHAGLREAFPQLTPFKEFVSKHTRYLWHDPSFWSVHDEGNGQVQPWPNADLAEAKDPLSGQKVGELKLIKETVGCPIIPGQGITTMSDLYSELYADPILMKYAYETYREEFISSGASLTPMTNAPRLELPLSNYVAELPKSAAGPESLG
jgi:hypothetical protein